MTSLCDNSADSNERLTICVQKKTNNFFSVKKNHKAKSMFFYSTLNGDLLIDNSFTCTYTVI